MHCCGKMFKTCYHLRHTFTHNITQEFLFYMYVKAQKDGSKETPQTGKKGLPLGSK